MPLADLLKIHIGVEGDPQEKKILPCLRKVREIRNANTLIKFIKTTLNFK